MFNHCPQCRSVAVVPIAYGKPGHDMMEAAKHGLLHLGGCVLEDNDHHCKACGYEWWECGYEEPKGITFDRLEQFFKELEGDLQTVHQDIERTYMSFGRNPTGTKMVQITDVMARYHLAWSTFLDRLQAEGGEPITVLDPKGFVRAQYSQGISRVYFIKNLYHLYSLLGGLADASERLGRASTGIKNDIDDLKNATVDLENARRSIRENFQMIKNAAMNYKGGG